MKHFSETVKSGVKKVKAYCWLAIVLCAGCARPAPAPLIKIRLADSARALQIGGIDPVILKDIDRDSVKSWQTLFAVYKLPADTDLKEYQPIQPGRYRLLDSTVLFTPDTPFSAHQQYYLRYYNYAGNKNIWDYIRGKTAKGQLHYTDLIFKR